MQDTSPVLSDPTYGGYTPFYLPWYDRSRGDDSPYEEPLSSSPEGLYGISCVLSYEADDDYSSRNDNPRADYGSGEGSNELGEYESYFASLWGEDSGSYGYGDESDSTTLGKNDAYISDDQTGSYYNYGDDPWTAYSDNKCSDYGFGFGDRIGEDLYDQSSQEHSYNSWDDLHEMTLYDRIFGF